jgi:hypothetical protein
MVLKIDDLKPDTWEWPWQRATYPLHVMAGDVLGSCDGDIIVTEARTFQSREEAEAYIQEKQSNK